DMSELQIGDQNKPPPTTSQDLVPIPERLRRGDVTLSMLWNVLPIGQLWVVCGAAVVLLVGAFSLGAWISAQAGEAKLRDSRTEMQSKITTLETNLKQQQIEYLERERATKADAAQAAEKVSKLTRSNDVLRVKQRFLVSCFSYYQTKDRDH